mgnify:CR=1 FL=1
MQIQIFTDGSCHTQQRIGGWAAIIFLEDEKIELKGFIQTSKGKELST